MRYTIIALALILSVSCAYSQRGPYFGQTPPSDSAVVFAPGIVSTGMKERDISFSSAGNEVFFCRDVGVEWNATILCSAMNDAGEWSAPEVLPFCIDPKFHYIEPCLPSDNSRLFFVSNMPTPSGQTGADNIWFAERSNTGWGPPKVMEYPINTSHNEYYPSFTLDGTLYFTAIDTLTNTECIFRSKLVNGKYRQREKLPHNVNIGKERFNAFVAPDESFIIVPADGMPDSRGGVDYYISFRNSNDEWSKPINLGDRVNSRSYHEYSVSISPDGKYLFFMSSRLDASILKPLSAKNLEQFHNSPQNGSTDIYWISTSFIDSLRLRTEFGR